MKKSKRYQECKKLVEKDKIFGLSEAIATLKKMPPAKFDETIELAVKLGVDSKRSEQVVRGTVALPKGTGKKIRVVVFCQGEDENLAREAGADYYGNKELIDKVSSGWFDFDVAVATPQMMREVSKLGRILGPRGLMPNPKAGTVTQDVAGTISDIKAGKVEFKMDKTSVVHIMVGKRSFETEALCENVRAVMDAIESARPQATKGQYVKSIYLSTTMGPALQVALTN